MMTYKIEMLTRQLKLKLNKTQEKELEQWLLHLTSIYNWAIRKIELNAQDKIYFSQFDFQNLLSGYSKKLDIPSCAIQGILSQAFNAWQRCFKRLSKKPRLKGRRRKLNSIPFLVQFKAPSNNKIKVPLIGPVKFYKQDLPAGSIKQGRILKKPSGWYLSLVIDAVHKFPVKETNKEVGIDPGFKTLLTLSDGTKFDNPKELRNTEKRLGQAQRGKRKQLTARLHERQANQRKDRNHKISRKLIEDYKKIYFSNDNFKGLAQAGFGKSVAETGLGQLIGMMTYKGRTGGREVIPVNSKNTTKTCSICMALTGPSGWNGLAVRFWKCSVCGTDHDRDINSAMVIFKAGAGAALKDGRKPSKDRNFVDV